MNEDPIRSPWPDRRDWGRAFEHADVIGVEIFDARVCVRLRSGVELEWPLGPSQRDRKPDDIG